MDELSIRLKQLREEKGLKQKDVASITNVTTSAYGFYEQGKRVPPPEVLIRLSKLFEVSIDYLLGQTKVRSYTSKISETTALKTIVTTYERENFSKEDIVEIENYIRFVIYKNKNKLTT